MVETDIAINNDTLLDEIKKNRTELKHCIEASEIRVRMKIEELNEKIKTLENENIQLKNKLEFLERDQKKNNILVYGLELAEDFTVDDVCEILSQSLEVSISHFDINDLYILSIPKNPIKIELISNLKKREIFNNCKKLKGTTIGISGDLTYRQRQDNKLLRHHLGKARENKTQKSFIKGNKLYVGDKEYTIESLKKLSVNKPIAHSEPSSPVPTRTSEQETTSPEDKPNTSKTQENQKSTPNTKNTTQAKSQSKPSNSGKSLVKNTFRQRLRSQKKS